MFPRKNIFFSKSCASENPLSYFDKIDCLLESFVHVLTAFWIPLLIASCVVYGIQRKKVISKIFLSPTITQKFINASKSKRKGSLSSEADVRVTMSEVMF